VGVIRAVEGSRHHESRLRKSLRAGNMMQVEVETGSRLPAEGKVLGHPEVCA